MAFYMEIFSKNRYATGTYRYPCCDSPFIDLTYEINLRRKTLFYTVNLIIPCVGIRYSGHSLANPDSADLVF